MKILSLDLSLSSPGFAVITYYNGLPALVDVVSVKTNKKATRGERLAHIEYALTKYIQKHKPFDFVIREDFQSKIATTNKAIYSVWGVADTVLYRFGYEINAEVNPKTMKSLIGGSGSADKPEIETGVRKLLNLPDSFKFTSDDQSDACGVALCYLMERNIIPLLHPKPARKTKKNSKVE